MKIRYPLWFSIYNLIIIPILFIGIHLARFFNRKIKQGIKERRGLGLRLTEIRQKQPESREFIVVHCASAGEFEAARPVLREIRRRLPELLIHVTCYSPSGLKPISKADEVDTYSYLPFDDLISANNFFKTLHPVAFLVVKHDIWPNMVWAAARHKVPSLWINANLHEETRRLGIISRGLNRSFLGHLTGILTVDESHAERLAKLISPIKIEVVGDSRYDRSIARKKNAQETSEGLVPASWLNGKKVIIGGSTWGPDQRILVPAVAALKKDYPDLYLILVPHEPHEDFLADTDYYLRKYNLRPIRYSQIDGQLPDSDVLIIDKVGILAQLYEYGWAAYIGGAFGEGVHSVLEPAVYDLPLFFGPRYYMSHEAQALVQCGAAISVEKVPELEDALRLYLEDESAWKQASRQSGELVRSGAGATERIVDNLEKVLMAEA